MKFNARKSKSYIDKILYPKTGIYWQNLKCFSELIKPDIPINRIRNFNIIAHIDHGQSTLADRLLQITGTIQEGHKQYLDKLKVEKERGITVKAQSAAMVYEYKGLKYLLNLIDTPGHVDFHYEVSRSMRSCRGSLLLVDATQGIQAQTLSNFQLAFLSGLRIIPIINKVDMIAAEPQETKQAMINQFNIDGNEVRLISAQTGLGVSELFGDIIQKIQPPDYQIEDKFKGFVIDSWYAKDLGVIMLFEIRGGTIKQSDSIISCGFSQRYQVFQVGIMSPEMVPKEYLYAGQVGYVVTNMKAVSEARCGDTFHAFGNEVQPEPGFVPAKPMVFAGLYPEDPEDYLNLEKNLMQLAITDPAVTIMKQSSAALGNGFRCGFLGLLHMDVFKERLDEEYEIESFLTTASVTYQAKLKKDGRLIEFENAMHAPPELDVIHYLEPMADSTIIIPKENLSDILNLCYDRRGVQDSMTMIDNQRYKLKFTFPLSEIIQDFFDKIQKMTSGYGSFDYEFKGYQKAKIQKLVITLMGEAIDALSFMVHEDRAVSIGKTICQKLKDRIPAHLFVVTIQAKIGSKIVAREDVSYYRQDVTAKCYGGDYSRKRKLLQRQQEGKKKMRLLGKVEVKKDTFKDLLKSE